MHVNVCHFCTYIAYQMWLLSKMLPLMVGQHIPESDLLWKSYLDLLQVLTLATAFEVTQDTISLMSLLVENYLSGYNMLTLPQNCTILFTFQNKWSCKF